ncbi:MAG: transcriptional repressor, partial [Paraprevotella sp.]|nr:transcriptional repressor [Paraprevotella sp.]
VYTTLRLFSEQGAAQMLTIDERKICFDGVITPHAHFMCKQCGKLFDMDLPENVDNLLPAKTDFKIDEVHLYYKGICKTCAAKTGV